MALAQTLEKKEAKSWIIMTLLKGNHNIYTNDHNIGKTK